MKTTIFNIRPQRWPNRVKTREARVNTHKLHPRARSSSCRERPRTPKNGQDLSRRSRESFFPAHPPGRQTELGPLPEPSIPQQSIQNALADSANTRITRVTASPPRRVVLAPMSLSPFPSSSSSSSNVANTWCHDLSSAVATIYDPLAIHSSPETISSPRRPRACSALCHALSLPWWVWTRRARLLLTLTCHFSLADGGSTVCHLMDEHYSSAARRERDRRRRPKRSRKSPLDDRVDTDLVDDDTRRLARFNAPQEPRQQHVPFEETRDGADLRVAIRSSRA